ncbi:secreted protein containing 3-hydroxyacyl-CoA dehydrogenase, NAD binding domain protein, partial [mine drainage metagenome]
GGNRMKVSVVGSGTMGRGIGQVFAQAGHQVKLIDINKEVLGKAKENIKESLARLEKKKDVN